MRLVTWNCNRGPAEKKLAALDRLDFDIAVLQEIPSNAPERVLWCGGSDTIGIGIVANPPYKANLMPIQSDDDYYAFPVMIDGPTSFNLLAVWAQTSPTYVAAMLRAIEIYRDHISNGSGVVAGDFNSNSVLDRGRSTYNHAQIVAMLANAGLSSAYHAYYGVPHGEESHPTLYWRRNEVESFHIDYCFIPNHWLERVARVEVGKYDAWREFSDHVPLLVELVDMG